MINKLLSCERAKWIFMNGLVAIGAGLTVKNVISFATECMNEHFLNSFVLH